MYLFIRLVICILCNKMVIIIRILSWVLWIILVDYWNWGAIMGTPKSVAKTDSRASSWGPHLWLVPEVRAVLLRALHFNLWDLALTPGSVRTGWKCRTSGWCQGIGVRYSKHDALLSSVNCSSKLWNLWISGNTLKCRKLVRGRKDQGSLSLRWVSEGREVLWRTVLLAVKCGQTLGSWWQKSLHPYVERYSVIERKEALIHAITWRDLENLMPTARSPSQKDHMFYESIYIKCSE